MMTDSLPTFRIRIHALDSTLADVRFEFDELPSDVEVGGRLMGPRCPGFDTIEVAYYLRRVPGRGAPHYQVLIPDPNLWSEPKPFVYEGAVEFRREGRLLGKRDVSLGLRIA